MIKTLSTYWLDIPLVSPLTGLTCTEFTLQVFVWSGVKSSPPVLSSYEITKQNPIASIGNARINISNVINDFIQFTPQEGTITELIDGNNQRWVKWQVFYATTEPLDATTPSGTDTKLMVKGYNYGLEAENKETPTNKVLLNGREFKVSRNSFFTVPIEAEETFVAPAFLTIDNMTLISGANWDLFWSGGGNLDDIFFKWRLDGTVPWTIGAETATTDPFSASITAVAGTYNVQLYSYDNDNAIFIYSNIFNIVVS